MENRAAASETLEKVVSSDDESDDEYNINTGQGWSCNYAADTLISQMKEEDRSTHFIAIRITVPEIVSKAMAIQKHIIKKEEVNNFADSNSSYKLLLKIL